MDLKAAAILLKVAAILLKVAVVTAGLPRAAAAMDLPLKAAAVTAAHHLKAGHLRGADGRSSDPTLVSISVLDRRANRRCKTSPRRA